jgi:hypothetical protein
LSPVPEIGRDQRSEADRPLPYDLVADLDAALGEQLLDVAQAQGEPKVEEHRLADDVGREAVALER